MTALQRCLLLVGGLVSLLGCTTPPRQPAVSESFALLKFTASMHLLALDEQTVDTRFSLDSLRVSPGQHVLRFVHVNAGPDGSAAHAGQAAAPFTLDVQEGLTYQFEAKTWGVIWRPAVASTTPMAEYCLTHACDTVAAHVTLQQLQDADCNK